MPSSSAMQAERRGGSGGGKDDTTMSRQMHDLQAASLRPASPAGLSADAPLAPSPYTERGTGEDALTVLAFTLAAHQFAVRVEAVLEIIEEPPLMPLPSSPPWMLGLVDIRGSTVPVVDLGARLGLTPVRHAGKDVSAPAVLTDAQTDSASHAATDATCCVSGGEATDEEGRPRDMPYAAAGRSERRIVVLDLGAVAQDDSTAVGVLCERVNDVWTVPADRIEAVPAFVEAQRRGGFMDLGSSTATPDDHAASSARPILSGVLRHAGGLAMLLDHQAALGVVPGSLATSGLTSPASLVADD